MFIFENHVDQPPFSKEGDFFLQSLIFSFLLEGVIRVRSFDSIQKKMIPSPHTFICLPSKRVIQIFIWSYSNMCVLLWAGKTWKGALPCANVVVIKFFFFFLLFFPFPATTNSCSSSSLDTLFMTCIHCRALPLNHVSETCYENASSRLLFKKKT